jgi:hypothetical protein
MIRRAALPAFLLASLLVGCGDDESPGGSGPGGGGDGGSAAGGNGDGGDPAMAEPEMVGVHAPDEFTVVAQLEGTGVVAPETASAYVIDSDFGTLAVTNIVYDAAANTITLTTDKQKLGVNYYLTIKAPGNLLDLETAQFLSADTATFWATDLITFEDYEVVANRVGVGELAVAYATEAGFEDGVEDAIAEFETKIYPTESALFNDMGDVDENGKMVMLGLDGHGQYGGYFSPVNALTPEQAEQFGANSNSMEMIYLSIPDLDGWDTLHTLPHEFSHLLYNESHGFDDGGWSWHNEGIAECAVHAVQGSNNYLFYYTQEMAGLGDGQSLVIWEYSNLSQYVQAYVFWTYVASRLDGVATYGVLFDLDGDPGAIDDYLQAELGQSLAQTQLDMLTATWLQEPTGPRGFEGMLDLGAQPQVLGSASAPLLPFTAVLLPANANNLNVAGAGPDVTHLGALVGAGPDLAAPFDVSGGVVIALNTNQDPLSTTTQSSGALTGAQNAAPPALPLLKKAAPSNAGLWKHPPPVSPWNRAALVKWRKAAHGI